VTRFGHHVVVSLSRKVYAKLPRYDTERAFVDAVLEELEPVFHIERQVRLTHWTGTRLVVDAVMRPREPEMWKDEDPVFAVEFKMPFLFHTSDEWDSTRAFTAWAAQSVDYANSLWDGPPQQRLRVFTCPSATAPFEGIGPANPDQPVLSDPAFHMPRLLWQLGVGELAKLEGDGWTLIGSGNHVLWSQGRGLQDGRRWGLAPRVGSR
jgi:hypothetical protein